MNILFRCDGSVEIGMGHVVRCLALADELWENHGCTISFAMRTSELGMSKVREKYPVLTAPEAHFNYSDWLSGCIQKTDAQVLIMDVRDGLHRANLVQIKKQTGIKIVTIDDPEDKRLASDLVFYPPVPQVKTLDWTGFMGKMYTGWEYVILRKEFKPKGEWSYPKTPNLVVTMGGTDPQDFTEIVVESLDELDANFTATIILGEGFAQKERLKQRLNFVNFTYSVLINPGNIIEYFSRGSLGIISFGMTAYEFATLGVPALYLCLTADHAVSARAFTEAGVGVSAGKFSPSGNKRLKQILSGLLSKPDQLVAMHNAAERVKLDRGTVLIGKMILEAL